MPVASPMLSPSDHTGKHVVLFFHPLDFTFVWPMEATAFGDRAEKFKTPNCQVIGTSVDSHFCHLAQIDTPKGQGELGPRNVPLASDPKRTIARGCGVFKADEGISFRGLFIADEGDLPVGRSAEEALRLVQAFHFTAQRGEACPAGQNLAVCHQA
ncbi:peroxiredoxin-1-like [Octodon degus]|uniref:Peroxiredoxin-1 n=1 Tax=Octodon degus TaxID=10160 RepID=A0A6P3V9D0_OCTDE|nr:peroxiredoxin-1-like [Octodon degus]